MLNVGNGTIDWDGLLYDGLLWMDSIGSSLVVGGWTEVKRRSEGGSTDVRVGGYCVPKQTVVECG